ncbi:MAG: dihydroorotate dehydrogenase electron transfer subunit [Candidatus Omnitrophota bacterium]
MIQTETKIIDNKQVTDKCYCLEVRSSPIARSASPGQFLEIKIGPDNTPFLRRPFSIHQINGSVIKVLYEVVGRGTEILSRRRCGEYLDIIGPLGKGFDFSPQGSGPCVSVLVAGGMGAAPLLFLAERLVNCPGVSERPLVLIGARNKKQVLCEKEFRALGCKVNIATDNGSKGFKGRATDLLKRILSRGKSIRGKGRFMPLAVYSCGPRPMLEAVSGLCRVYRIPAQISLERHMACGIGACMGCAVATTQGLKRACKEGPVFKAGEIIWD